MTGCFRSIFNLFLIFGVFFCVFSDSLCASKKIKISSSELVLALNQVVDSTALLHKTCVNFKSKSYKQEMDQVVQKLQLEMQQAQELTSRTPQTGQHIQRMLERAQFGLSEFVSSSYKSQKNLKKTFKQLAILVETYDVKSYPVYFCHLDRSLWFQSQQDSPRNPVSPRNFSRCAKRVMK